MIGLEGLENMPKMLVPSFSIYFNIDNININRRCRLPRNLNLNLLHREPTACISYYLPLYSSPSPHPEPFD